MIFFGLFFYWGLQHFWASFKNKRNHARFRQALLVDRQTGHASRSIFDHR